MKSLAGTTLLFEPGTRTKYSNAGLAVVGAVVERVVGKPFPKAIDESALEAARDDAIVIRARAGPGCKVGSWRDVDVRRTDDRDAHVSAWHGPRGQPGFVGKRPGSIRQLLVCPGSRTIRGGRQAGDPAIDDRAAPGKAGEPAGFGLGFAISKLDGERRIGHNGAVYGFATDVQALPDARLGVVVITIGRLRQRNCQPHRDDRPADDARRAQRPPACVAGCFDAPFP